MDIFILVLFLFTSAISAQQFKVIDVKGDVKFQSGTSEAWSEVKNGEVLQMDGFISTGQNSSFRLKMLRKLLLSESSPLFQYPASKK